MIEKYIYTIGEDNSVSIFNTEYPNEDGSAGVWQPWHPSTPNEPFASKEEASTWAEECIDNMLNPPAIVIEETPAE